MARRDHPCPEPERTGSPEGKHISSALFKGLAVSFLYRARVSEIQNPPRSLVLRLTLPEEFT